MRFRVLLYAAVLVSIAAVSVYGQASPATLIDAVQTGNRGAAFKLIDQKVDVRTAAADGTTALHWAAHNGDVDLVGPADQSRRQRERKK
jgi:ankyrin repeat protein